MPHPTPRPFGEAVRALLAEHGLSIRELARRTHYDRGYLTRVLSGKQAASAALAMRVDEALSTGGELAALAEADPPPLGGSEDHAGDLVEVMRRVESTDLGPGTLDVLHGAVEQLACDYPTMPGPQLRDRSTRLMRQTLGMLEGRTTLAQHRELLVEAGWLSVLLGCVHFDTNDRVAAESARRLAHRLGEQAGHGEIIGWSYELAAWAALSQGRYRAVVAAAEAGRAHAGISSAGVQLLVQQAKAAAKMGDTSAHGLLREAEAMLHRLPPNERPENHLVFDPEKLTSHAATAYTWLGWDETAGEYAAEMAQRYEREYRPMRLATARINLGLLAGRRGDLDDAVSLGMRALDFERRSGALLSWAEGLHRELSDRYPGEPLVRELRDRLAEEQDT